MVEDTARTLAPQPPTPNLRFSFAHGAPAALRIITLKQQTGAGLQNKGGNTQGHPESLFMTSCASLIYLPEKVTERPMAGFQLTLNLLDLTELLKFSTNIDGIRLVHHLKVQ